MPDDRPTIEIKSQPQPHRDLTNPSTVPLPGNFLVRGVDEYQDEIRQGELQPPLDLPPSTAGNPGDRPYTPMTPEERAKRKALLITALERGVVHDRLHVDLPPHLHGEWCRRDPLEIQRLHLLGFWSGQKYVEGRALHTDGASDGVLDVVFMVTTRDNKELIDEVRQEQFFAINAKPGERKALQKEEKDFIAQSQADTGGEIPTYHDGTLRAARKADIVEALQKANAMIQTQVTPVPSRG